MIYGIGLGLQRSLNLLLLPLLTREFPPADYGRLEILLAAVSFLSLLGMMQLDSATGRYFFEDKKEEIHFP